jgi:hypothetical protein
VFGTRALMVGAWMLATLLAGSVTWAAVATFGPDGGTASSHVLSQSDVRRQLVRDASSHATTSPTQSTAPTRPAHGNRHHDRATTTPAESTGPTSPPRSSDGPTHSSQSQAGGGVKPPPTHGTSDPTATSTGHGSDAPSTPHTSSAPPQAQSRSWQFDGGRVGASCSGSVISVVYATPDDGWQMEQVDGGPDRLEYRFREEADHLTRFTAQCFGGAPVAQIDQWGEGDDDGPPGGGERGRASDE